MEVEDELTTRRQILKDLQSTSAIMNRSSTPAIPKAVTFEDEKATSPDSLLSDDTRSLPELPSSQWAMMELNTTIDVDVGASTIFSPVSRGIFDTPAGHRTTGSLDSLMMETSTTPFNVFRLNSTNIALHESQAYLEKIEDLQSKLKVPITPAQSTAQMLWERNDTLVKEIRFADTTCVELSNKLEQLQQNVKDLETQKEQLKTDKGKLKDSLDTSEKENTELTKTIEGLSMQLESAKESKDSLQNEYQNKMSEWENKRQTSQNSLESATREIEALKAELAEAREELQQQATTSQLAMDDLRNSLDQKNSENEFLQSQLELRVRDYMERLCETANSQLENLKNSVESKQSLLSARLDRSNAHLVFLSTQLEFDNGSHIDGATTPSHTIPSIPTEALNLTTSQSIPTHSVDTESIPTQSLDMTPLAADNNAPKTKQSMDTLEGFDGYSLLSDLPSSKKTSAKYKQTSEFGQHLEWMASPTPFLKRQQADNADESIGSASELTSSEGGVSYLEQELENVRTQLSAMTQERDALASLIESMTQSGTNGSNHLEHERRQKLHDEKDRLESELAEKSESLEAALNGLADLKAKMLATDISKLELQLQDSRQENTALLERLTLVSQRLEETERLLVEARMEKKQIRAILSAKSHSMDDLRRNLELVQAEKDALSLKVDVRTKDCRELQKGLAYYQAPTTNCKGAKRKQRFKPWARKEQKVRVKTPHKVIMMSPDPKSPGSYESKALLKRIASLENEIRNLTTSQLNVKEIGAELAKAKAMLDTVSSERDNLREQIEKLRNSFGEDLKAVQKAHEQLQAIHKSCEERLLSECAALADAQKENDRLVSQLESALENNSINEELVKKHGQQLRDSQTELQSCHDKIASYEDELRAAHAVYEADREQLLKRLSESKNHYEKLREQLKTAENKVSYEQAEAGEQICNPPENEQKNTVSDVRRAEQCFREALRKLESTRSHRDALILNLENLSDRLGQTNGLRVPNRITRDHKVNSVALEATKATECLNRMLAIENELSEVENLLQISSGEARELRESNECLSLKCGRLKDYIRKLTKKCGEWEEFHQRESEVLRKLKIANNRTMQKALELAERYQQSDMLYTVEKLKVNTLQEERRQLELELGDIAREISNVRVNI